MTIKLSDAVAAAKRLRLNDRYYGAVQEAIFDVPRLGKAAAESMADDLKLIGDYLIHLAAEDPAEGSTFKKLFDQVSSGGEFSVETREIAGDFQQRPVLKGGWESVEKPSGLN